MSNQQTLETVLQGYVVAVAAQNFWLRNEIAKDIENVDQFKAKVENAIKNDIENAKNQLPNFLKVEEIPAELEAKLRDIHINAFFSALEADSEVGLRNLSVHFGILRTSQSPVAPALTVVEGGKTETTPPTPPAAPPAPPTPPEAAQ